MTHPTPRTSATSPAGTEPFDGRATSYHGYWAMCPLDRVEWIKTGAPAEMTRQLAKDLGIPKARLCKWLQISSRRPARSVRMSRIEGERVLGLARLVGETEQIMRESSDPLPFDAARWMGQWLQFPNPSLGGAEPREYVDCGEGRALLSTLLRQQQSGVCL